MDLLVINYLMGIRFLKDKGVKRFGLHTMVASNELDISYFLDTAKMLFELAAELSKELDISFEFKLRWWYCALIATENPVDLLFVRKGVQELYQYII